LEATALLFVAYTGYGRVATLGEEIKNPARNIPKAVIATLALSFILYVTVAGVALSRVDGSGFYELTVESSAPLERIAALSGLPIIANLLAIGAITALLGVLLNLILGVSRVVFAMGRKRDLPDIFTRISVRSHVPTWSVLATGVLILVLV